MSRGGQKPPLDKGAPPMSLRDKLNNFFLLKKCWSHIYWSKSVSKKMRSRGIDGQSISEFNTDKDNNLLRILELLEQNKYKLNTLFGFPVKKENKNEYRLITAATVKDRIIHKAIFCLVNKGLYEYVNTGVSYCGVKKNVLDNKHDEDVLNTKKAIKKLIQHVGDGYFFSSNRT